MGLITYLILLAITGLIVGALARLLLPGRDPMSLLETMLMGILGSFVAGLVVYAVTGERHGASFLLSLAFAMLFVWLYRKLRRSGSDSYDSHGRHSRHRYTH